MSRSCFVVMTQEPPCRQKVAYLMQKICNFLFDTGKPLWRFCLLAFPLAFIPSIGLVAGVNWLFDVLGVHFNGVPPHYAGTAYDFLIVGLLGPALETCLLAFVIYVLSEFFERKLVIACISAFLWACLHGASAALWFFGVIWSFFVFSCAYIVWRKQSFWYGFIAAAVPHALNNITLLTVGLIWHI